MADGETPPGVRRFLLFVSAVNISGAKNSHAKFLAHKVLLTGGGFAE
jgi:hypothetical protein